MPQVGYFVIAEATLSALWPQGGPMKLSLDDQRLTMIEEAA
jgi:hypothetical protein